MTAYSTWEGTLSPFIDASNENELILEHFDQVVMPRLLARVGIGQNLDWLDVGPGDGTKTQVLLDAMVLSGVGHISATLLEPHQPWHSALGGIKTNSGSSLQIVEQSFQAFTDKVPLSRFDLVSMLHVLYHRSLVSEVSEWIRYGAGKAGGLVYMVMEDPANDMAKLRALLRKSEISAPETQYSALIEELEQRSIPFDSYDIDKQRCRIDRGEVLSDNTHWLFPFLLGVSNDEYHKLSDSLRERIREITRSFVQALKHDELKIDDKAVLVHLNKE